MPQIQSVVDEVVPAYLKELFQTQIEQLKAFEFEPVSYLETESTVKLGHPKAWELLLYNKTLKIYARSAIRRPVEPFAIFDLELWTVFPDQTALCTMNGKGDAVLGELPGVILQDPYSDRFSVQLEVHQSRLAQFAVEIPEVSPDEFITQLEQLAQQHFTYHIERNHFRKSAESNEFHLDWRFILQFLPHLKRHHKKANRVLQQLQVQAKRNDSPAIETPIELEVENFYRTEQLQRGSGRERNTKLWILLGSFALFLAAYAQVFPLQKLIIFVVAITFHEAGHLLAMQLFGYKDTAVLFIPFLGALATARKEDATLTQKFWVSLAGPLPGLILGLCMAIANHSGSYPDWVSEAGWIFIGLNLFNLLPMYPLDGGQIADLLIFSRSPYAGLIFKGIGAFLLVLIGLGKPLMLMFAVLIALTIPFSFRSDKMTAKIGKELSKLPTHEKDQVLFFIFERIRQMGYSNLPSAKRYVLAKNLVDRQKEVQSKWTTRLFLSSMYGVSLVAGITGMIFAAIPDFHTVLPLWIDSSRRVREVRATLQKDVEQSTQTLQSDPKNLKAYQKRARAYLRLNDPQNALADYNQLIRLSPKDSSFLIDRAGIHTRNGHYQNAIQDYDRAIQVQPNLMRAYRLRADMKMQLKDYPSALRDFDKLVQSGDKFAYLRRGEVHLQLGNFKAAIADASTAIHQTPDLAEAYELRSKARAKAGDQQGAIADQQKAETLYKEQESAEE